MRIQVPGSKFPDGKSAPDFAKDFGYTVWEYNFKTRSHKFIRATDKLNDKIFVTHDKLRGYRNVLR